jgi:hypothetical protein
LLVEPSQTRRGAGYPVNLLFGRKFRQLILPPDKRRAKTGMKWSFPPVHSKNIFKINCLQGDAGRGSPVLLLLLAAACNPE